MQYTQSRIADIAIDLYAHRMHASRGRRARIEQRGEEGARRELDLTYDVRRRGAEAARGERGARSTKNDDELRKSVADRAYVDGGYPFDVL